VAVGTVGATIGANAHAPANAHTPNPGNGNPNPGNGQGQEHKTGATPVAAPSPPTFTCNVNLTPGMDVAATVAANPSATTFCFAPGTYSLVSTVKVKASDNFVGVPGNLPVIDASAVNVGFMLGSANTVTFEYMEIDNASGGAGPKLCGQTCGRGILGGDGLQIFDSVFQHNASDAIAGSGTTTTTPWLIVGSTFNANGSTPFLNVESGGIKGSQAFTILNSTATNNVGQGIWCDVGCIGGTWTVEGNTVTGNTQGGIRYEISNAGAVIEDNLVENNDTSNTSGLGGIQIASSGNATVENNTALQNLVSDIRFTSGRSPGLSNDVEKNNAAGAVILGCNRTGVTCS
jgi:parallel beta-helix repeat protein